MMAQPNCLPPSMNNAIIIVNIFGNIATKAKAKIIQSQTESMDNVALRFDFA